MVSGLHPTQLDDLGLLADLRWYSNDNCSSTGVYINIFSHGIKPDLTSDVRSVVFRIAKEAITNVVHHAKDTQIDIQVNYTDGSIYLRMEDNVEDFNTDEVMEKQADKPTA